MRRAGFLRARDRARESPRYFRRARPRLRRYHFRRLEGAFDHAGERRARYRGGVLHHVEELQHGGLAHRVHGRQQGPRPRARADQELPRLRHFHADTGRLDRRPRRSAGLRSRAPHEVPAAPRRHGARPARAGLAGRESEGIDVHLGEDPRGLRQAWLARIRKKNPQGREGRRVSGDRIRRPWGRSRENRADRKRGPHPTSHPRDPRYVPQGRIAVMRIVEVTDESGVIAAPDWLKKAEAVHRQLRTALPPEYEAKMKRVFAGGARMCVAADGADVAGMAVYRMYENTFYGKQLYVDDLVTDEARRSSGVGRTLLGYLEQKARAAGFDSLTLDSGTQRLQAHKFYFREGMAVTSFHFMKKLK